MKYPLICLILLFVSVSCLDIEDFLPDFETVSFQTWPTGREAGSGDNKFVSLEAGEEITLQAVHPTTGEYTHEWFLNGQPLQPLRQRFERADGFPIFSFSQVGEFDLTLRTTRTNDDKVVERTIARYVRVE